MTIYEQAIAKWGIDSQLGMLVEECAEVIQAVNRRYRKRINTRELIAEMVDVEIMLEQMRSFFPGETWDEIKAHKLQRLQERLEAQP